MKTCPRCGDRFTPQRPDDRHCPRCEAEVRAIVEADERRNSRFRFAKDLGGKAA